MNGSDRRTEAACPCPAARDSLYTPVRVVELDLEEPGELRSPGGSGPADPDGRVLALVRLHGHPLGLVTATGTPGDPAGLRRALVDAARLTAPAAPGYPPTHRAPGVTVVIATHNRPDMLRRCLDSVLRADPPPLDVVVVDSAPADRAARDLVRTHYRNRVRYLHEPLPGLARAHNRALPAATGEVVAFTDDDTLVDPRWPGALADAFAADPDIGCVTGLIVPAELETAAQAALEEHGGFAKGFAARRWSLTDPPADPLFPFTAGRFGSGANMAFRTRLLRDLGGFDPAMGTGTPARGGDDLLAFFRVLVAGHTLAYQPDAIVWHHHRRTPESVPAQALGYGMGLGAYLTAAVRHEPAMLPALLRRLPQGIGHAAARARSRTAAARGGTGSPPLARLELQGLLCGPLGYLRSLHQARTLDLRS
jgi:GT2 family glycosyltransferase